VWELTNPAGDEIFSKAMFMVAVHLMTKNKKDNLALPQKLPALLAESAGLLP